MFEAPPWPFHEWNEIIPGLYQGGHIYLVNGHPFTTKLRGVRLFDYVLSLHEEDNLFTRPDDDIEHTIWLINDDPWRGVREYDEGPLRNHVEHIARRVADNQKVLVRCQAGYNRSGLVVALVLVRLGYSARQAIQMVRQNRSHWALCNKKFEQYVLDHEAEYRPQVPPRTADPVFDRPGGGSEPS